MDNQYIEITRREGEDAHQVAARCARDAGTRLSGNMRWYGGLVPAYRQIGTDDGRVIRVNEPIPRNDVAVAD